MGRIAYVNDRYLPPHRGTVAVEDRGCREAWLYDERRDVAAGSASRSWIVDRKDRLLTRPTDRRILCGVTRDVVLELARGGGIEVAGQPFALQMARAARGAFRTGTASRVLPVTTIDGSSIGDGRPGPVTRRPMRLYSDHVYAAVGQGGRPTAAAA